jgi:hypothetical protein
LNEKLEREMGKNKERRMKYEKETELGKVWNREQRQ